LRFALLLLLALALAWACVEVRVSRASAGSYSTISVTYYSSCYGELKVAVKPLSPVYSLSGPLNYTGGQYVLKAEVLPGEVGGFKLYMKGAPKAIIKVYFDGSLLYERYVGVTKCLDASVSYSSALSSEGPVLVVGLALTNYCDRQALLEVKVEGKGALSEAKRSWCAEEVGKVIMVKKCVEQKCLEWVKEKVCVERKVVCEGGSCKSACLKEGYAYECSKVGCSKYAYVPKVVYECAKRAQEVIKSSFPAKGNAFEGSVKLGPREGRALEFLFREGPVKVYLNGEELELASPPGPPVRVEWVPFLGALLLLALSLTIIFLF